eukprot:6867855-Lingulodinium_polyedra.AAC.1
MLGTSGKGRGMLQYAPSSVRHRAGRPLPRAVCHAFKGRRRPVRFAVQGHWPSAGRDKPGPE